MSGATHAVIRSARQAALVLTLLLAGAPVLATELPLPRDGWASWQVPAVAGAPAWCCFDWKRGGRAGEAGCRLDGGSQVWGSHDGATTDTLRLYARFADGRLQAIRALAPHCPVTSPTDIADLGAVDVDTSARWLSTQVVAGGAAAEDALAALAAHAGAVAGPALAGFARAGDDRERREQALFWLGQLRPVDGADTLKTVLAQDPSPDLREHAAFALAQSQVADRIDALIRAGRSDPEAEVRGQAWFWLAQTEAPQAEAAITAALASESEADIHDRLVFALSQLPDDRAVAALAAIVEDPARPREMRRRALFWLGQSEAPQAQALLARLLHAD